MTSCILIQTALLAEKFSLVFEDCIHFRIDCCWYILMFVMLISNAGVSNSKLYKGRIAKENVSTGRRLKWKRLCGPHYGAQSIEIC